MRRSTASIHTAAANRGPHHKPRCKKTTPLDLPCAGCIDGCHTKAPEEVHRSQSTCVVRPCEQGQGQGLPTDTIRVWERVVGTSSGKSCSARCQLGCSMLPQGMFWWRITPNTHTCNPALALNGTQDTHLHCCSTCGTPSESSVARSEPVFINAHLCVGGSELRGTAKGLGDACPFRYLCAYICRVVADHPPHLCAHTCRVAADHPPHPPTYTPHRCTHVIWHVVRDVVGKYHAPLSTGVNIS